MFNMFVNTGPAQNGPLLFKRYWVAFQRQWTKTPSHAAEACAEERTLTFSCTKNQSLAPHPNPHPHKNRWLRNKRNLNIRTFQKQRMPCPRGSCVDNKRPRLQGYPIKTCPTSTLANLSLYLWKQTRKPRFRSLCIWAWASPSPEWHQF